MTLHVTAVHPVDRVTKLARPLFGTAVSAGFPSPADDYVERKLDLNEHLIEHLAATFFVRVSGDSMVDAGIRSGDLLVVDRAVPPADGSVVIAVLDGELTVRRLRKEKGRLLLVSESPAGGALAVGEEADFEVWGVVRHVVRSLE